MSYFDGDYQNLMAKFNTFINGPKDVMIGTDSGQIKTLAGIQEGLKKSSYIQKVVDYPTIVAAAADALSGVILKDGNLARVYKDPNAYLNGLYEVQTDGTLKKIDYVDLVNLTANKRVKQFDQMALKDPAQNRVARLTFPASETRSIVNHLKGSIFVYSRVIGKMGFSGCDFTMTYMTIGDTIEQGFIPTNSFVGRINNDFAGTLPTLKAYWEAAGTSMVLTLRLEGPTVAEFLDTDLVRFEIEFTGLDGHSLL